MIVSLLRHLRAKDREWYEADASLDDSTATTLPPSLSLLILVLGVVTLYAGGCAIGWW